MQMLYVPHANVVEHLVPRSAVYVSYNSYNSYNCHKTEAFRAQTICLEINTFMKRSDIDVDLRISLHIVTNALFSLN